ncbi:hypothetical protein [Streptomyces lydicus]|uniref:Uncharacterized protein n=1 Tax=Streptomyces lydicus TaxID=47763 RepID=A0A1D7VGJ4_9ACTN|nr:hypothetical protein [Streptomyces lydicus]AOP45678.1 hypothetical protein SL103_04965 [Streptomyces lydicus]
MAEEVTRLIALRSAYRDWDLYLHSVTEATVQGYRRESADAVLERIEALRAAVEAASDAAMQDGLWIGSERMPFEIASHMVRVLVTSTDAAAPSRALTDVREARTGFNRFILHRLEEISDGTVTRVHPPPAV